MLRSDFYHDSQQRHEHRKRCFLWVQRSDLCHHPQQRDEHRVTSIGSYAFYDNLKKIIWLTNTPPSGYNNAAGTVNYVSNDQFNISNKVVYKFLSSYFDVDGIRYVPVSPSDRSCDAIDCIYDESAENINIGKTVTNKGITLTVMKINPYTCYQNKYINDVNLSFDGDIGDYAFQNCSVITTATINNQGAIGSYAFNNCPALTTAVLGQKVTSIGNSAFGNCSKLNSIVIPDAVTSIGSNAFSNCSSMASAKIGNGVQTINDNAFSDCSALPSITIPSAVSTIKNSVFYNCTSLAKVIIADSEAELKLGANNVAYYSSYTGTPLFADCPLDSVYIGRNIDYNTTKKYGYSPFYRNTSLRAVKITDKETEISANEFYGCTNLQRVIIGDGVTTIGNWAFSGCQSLKYFAFGSQVANIGQDAFSDCTAVVEISSKAQVAPICGTQALDDINKWDCKLYVPNGCLAVYQSADQWRDFFFTEIGEGTASQSDSGPFEPNKCEKPTISMNGDKVTFGCKTEGVTYHYSISSSDAQNGVGNQDVELKKTLTITVYATKDGYSDSDITKSEFKISSSGIPGDVNNDGKVNATDHVVLSNIILNK